MSQAPVNDSQAPETRARLFCQTGPHRGQAFFLGLEADIGSAAAAKITIKGAKMDQRQARIRYSDRLGAYVLENLSKSRPLLLDGKAVTRPRRLGDLHVLTFPGGHDYIFQVLRDEVGMATSPGVFVKYVPSGLLEESQRDPSQRPEPKTRFDQVLPTPAVFSKEAEEGPAGAGERQEAMKSGTPSRGSQQRDQKSEPEPVQARRQEEGPSPSVDEDTQAGAALPLPSLPGGVEKGAAPQEKEDSTQEDLAQASKPPGSDQAVQEPPARGPSSQREASQPSAPSAAPSKPSPPQEDAATPPETGQSGTREAPSERPAGEESPSRTSPQAAPSADAEQRRSGFLLMVAEEQGTARSYPLREGKNLIGRMDDCQVVLGHKAVSRRQAALLVSPGRVVVSDLGGLNPTLVDGQPLQGEVELRPGQELRMGPFRATLIRRSEERRGS